MGALPRTCCRMPEHRRPARSTRRRAPRREDESHFFGLRSPATRMTAVARLDGLVPSGCPLMPVRLDRIIVHVHRDRLGPMHISPGLLHARDPILVPGACVHVITPYPTTLYPRQTQVTVIYCTGRPRKRHPSNPSGIPVDGAVLVLDVHQPPGWSLSHAGPTIPNAQPRHGLLSNPECSHAGRCASALDRSDLLALAETVCWAGSRYAGFVTRVLHQEHEDADDAKEEPATARCLLGFSYAVIVPKASGHRGWPPGSVRIINQQRCAPMRRSDWFGASQPLKRPIHLGQEILAVNQDAVCLHTVQSTTGSS